MFIRSTRDAIFVILLAVIICIPLAIDLRGDDIFRLPKEIIFRAGAVLVLLFAAFLVSSRKRVELGFLTLPVLTTAAIVAWTTITSVTSQNRFLSADSLITVICSATFFLAASTMFENRGLIALDCLFFAAAVNAILMTMQEYAIWQPFHFEASFGGHQSTTGLMGNPNDGGMFLLAPALAAVVATMTLRGMRRRRIAYAGIAIILLVGLLVSATRAAILAYAAALAVIFLRRSWKEAVAVLAFLVIAIGVSLMPGTTVGRNFRVLADGIRQRQLDVVFSERLPPFLAAVEMVREHPWLGVGPGGFKFQYLHYRLQIEHRYPSKWTSGWPMNFSQTHSDHLQTAAEVGLPGYGLMLVAAGVLALPGWRKPRVEELPLRTFAHEFRIPLVLGFLVLALAQFPLQIPASRAAFLFLSGICVAWDK